MAAVPAGEPSARRSAAPPAGEPPCYEIIVAGHVPARWSDWFAGLTVSATPDGHTRLRGPLPDQAALLGVLNRVDGLHLRIVRVTVTPP